MSKKNKNKNKNKNTVNTPMKTITAILGKEKLTLTGASKKIDGVRFSECEPTDTIVGDDIISTTKWVKSSLIDAIAFTSTVATQVLKEA